MTHQSRLLLSFLTLGLLQACSAPAPIVHQPPPLIEEPASLVGATMLLVESAHVCRDEAETKRLAASAQLRSMARYLAEVLPTYNCSITELTNQVEVLEEAPGYRKVNLNQNEVFTFDNYLLPAATAEQAQEPSVSSCC
ncbi:MAG: hypothetical protein LAT66_00400 [Alkalimonas sp.]|nr:hypothetical protein [Alkalimonas sp.]